MQISSSTKNNAFHKPPSGGFDKSIASWLFIILVAMILASIHPLDWSSYLLHQAGTVVFMGMVWLCYRFLKVSKLSFGLASLFILIHILGARYLYSYVPYDDWLFNLFGFQLNEMFGWERNMYDRLVHFSYGLLLFPLMRDVFKSLLPSLTTPAIILLVLQFNLATSTLYELFEWLIAIGLSPEKAEAYNGQQGDIWDAHKDTLLAFVGSLFSSVISFIHSKVTQNNKQTRF